MSLLRQYQRELALCREKFDAVDLHKERGYLAKFTTFSANVQNVLPGIPRSQHESMFREVLMQQVFTSFDQVFLDAGELVKFQGQADELLRPTGARIYCTYHLGSYRLLTSLLFRRGVDCVLLVGSNLNRSQGDGMQEHIDALRQRHGLTNLFRVVEAGSPSTVMTVLRELKAGRSLIVYIDGSPETAPKPGEETQFLPVCLGNRHVFTRKGVGYLSYLSGAPIVPVVTYRQPNLTNVVECLETILPDRQTDRETFCGETMQQLYDGFWPYLKRYPGQWEGWNFIHGFLKPEVPPKTVQQLRRGRNGARNTRSASRPTFNEYRYTLCDLEEAPVLFDRLCYETYEISPDLRDLLLNLNEIDSVEETVGPELFGELVEKEILC